MPAPNWDRVALTRLTAAQHALTRAEGALAEAQARADPAAGDNHDRWLMSVADEAVSTSQMALESAHRAVTTRKARPLQQAIPDTDGYDLCPDPLIAQTPAELVDALRRYRLWAGEPSFRRMAASSRQRAAASTLCAALSGETLPTLDVVLGVVIGCGGSEDDQCRFATAWRRIRLGERGSRPNSAERPTLQVLRTAAEAI